jgi:hypothetical protein
MAEQYSKQKMPFLGRHVLGLFIITDGMHNPILHAKLMAL